MYLYSVFPKLNLPTYQLPIRRADSKLQVWDLVRKKWVLLTPEEWVRQHWLHHLINHHNFPQSLIAVEKSFNLNGLTRRFDIMAGHPPQVIIECKASDVTLTQETFNQVARYNTLLRVPHLIISNGLQHLTFKMNESFTALSQIQELPLYEMLNS